MTGEEIAAQVRQSRPESVQRVLLAVTVMHEPDRHGRCRWCRPEVPGWRRWRRAPQPCPTLRVIDAHLVAAAQAEPQWTPA